MVAATIVGEQYEQHDNAIVLSQHSRAAATEAYPPRPPLELQDSGTHCPTYIPRLEHNVS